MAKKKNKAAHKPHKGKPQGMTYADELARKRMIKEACQQAANDTTVKVRADIHTQKVQWLTMVALNHAFEFGPIRFQRLGEALIDASDWYEEMRDKHGEEYANEKLRQKAEQITGCPIEYLYEAEFRAAEERMREESQA